MHAITLTFWLWLYIHVFDNDFKNFYLSLLHWSMYSTNHHWTSKCWSVTVHLILCPINQFIPNKFNDSIKKQISCTRMVKSVASGPHQTIRACNNYYTYAEAPCMHKIHVGSAIWLQVTLLLFKVVTIAI